MTPSKRPSFMDELTIPIVLALTLGGVLTALAGIWWAAVPMWIAAVLGVLVWVHDLRLLMRR